MEDLRKNQDKHIVIDMTLDGDFREAPRPTLAQRIGRVAIAVTVLAVLVALVGFVVFAMAIAIPVAIGAGVIAWLALQWQRWKSRS